MVIMNKRTNDDVFDRVEQIQKWITSYAEDIFKDEGITDPNSVVDNLIIYRIARLEITVNKLLEHLKNNIMKKKFYWIRIDEDDNKTLPEVGKEVLIVSEEGRMSVERRRKGHDFIYSDSTDTGVALFWMDLPDYPNHKF